MKKILFIASIFFLLLSIPSALAASTQGFTALAPIPGLTDANSGVVNSKSLSDFFNNLYKYLIGLAAVLAVIQITWSGIKIATNRENVSTLMDSKGRITQSILGLVLVLSPVLVFSIINPNILNLSLNLPALDIKSGIPISTSGAPTNVTGCTTTNGPAAGTVLVACVAPDENAAQSEVVDFLSTNCSGSNNIGEIVSSVCSNYTTVTNNGRIEKNCTQATATAYCSPIVTASIVQKSKITPIYGANTSVTSYIDLGYFGENNTFTSSCKGSKWSLTRSGGTATKINEGTNIECPVNDPSYQKIISGQKQGTLLKCVSVPVYCKYYK